MAKRRRKQLFRAEGRHQIIVLPPPKQKPPLFGPKGKARPAEYWTFGEQCGKYLEQVLPQPAVRTAAATCRIEVQGLKAIGNCWGLGFQMRMLTKGAIPTFDDCTISRCGNWVTTHSRTAVEAVLNCYNLTVTDLLKRFGFPQAGEKYTVDLPVICKELQIAG